MMTVTGLWIYPIKSCQGIELTEMNIQSTGPVHDRQFMLVNETGLFLSLRTHPRLSQIQTEINQEQLVLKTPMAQHRVSLRSSEAAVQTDVQIFKKYFKADLVSEEVDQALSDWLHEKVRLVRFNPNSYRSLGAGAEAFSQFTQFADSRPVLLTNEASVASLNEKLKSLNEPLTEMKRFRPNIVIQGLDAFAEEKIKKIRIGSVEFENPELCSRCVIVTQDSQTGAVASKATLKILPLHSTEKGPKLMFGLHLRPSSAGLIRRGDPVTAEFV